jgi:hypothetical protein
LFIDALDDLFDPTADRTILLRSEHHGLACPFLRRKRRRAIFFKALDAVLHPLQPVNRALQPILCRAADRRPRGFFTTFEFIVERAAHDAGIGNFGIAQLAGLMDLAPLQTQGGSAWDNFVHIANEVSPRALLADIAARLCGIVFVRQTALGSSLDFQRISLRAMCRYDKIVMRGFGPA